MLKHSRLGSCREKNIQVGTEKSKQRSPNKAPLCGGWLKGKIVSQRVKKSRFHLKNYILRSSDGCGTEGVQRDEARGLGYREDFILKIRLLQQNRTFTEFGYTEEIMKGKESWYA